MICPITYGDHRDLHLSIRRQRQMCIRDSRTTLLGYIFATKARIDNRKKNLLSSNTSFTCPYNMVNFGPLAEILSLVRLGHPS